MKKQIMDEQNGINRERQPFLKRVCSDEGGWAMTETLLAVVIVAVVLGSIFGIYRMTTNNTDLQKEQQNISAVRASVRQAFSGQPDYTGLTNTVADNSGAFPVQMKKSGGVRNTWNGAVTVAPVAANTTLFTITYAAVPQEACVKLSTFDYGSWQTVLVGSTSIPQTSGGVVAASGACGASNTLIYTTN